MNFCNGSNSYNGRIPENSFCAGSIDGSRDACFGGNQINVIQLLWMKSLFLDSGGGLICNNQIAGGNF